MPTRRQPRPEQRRQYAKNRAEARERRAADPEYAPKPRKKPRKAFRRVDATDDDRHPLVDHAGLRGLIASGDFAGAYDEAKRLQLEARTPGPMTAAEARWHGMAKCLETQIIAAAATPRTAGKAEAAPAGVELTTDEDANPILPHPALLRAIKTGDFRTAYRLAKERQQSERRPGLMNAREARWHGIALTLEA